MANSKNDWMVGGPGEGKKAPEAITSASATPSPLASGGTAAPAVPMPKAIASPFAPSQENP